MGDVPQSCDVSDACDRLKVPAVRSGAFRPLWSECRPVAGPVRIVRLEPAQGEPSPLPALLDVITASAGHVLLVDLEGRDDVQCWGTVLATAARRCGLPGALVNGAARDVEGLAALGLPAYARGVFPAAIRGRLRLAAVDEPSDIDGEQVAPGSFVVADSSGAVFFACTAAADVLAMATTLAEQERRLLQEVADGDDLTRLLAPSAETDEPARMLKRPK